MSAVSGRTFYDVLGVSSSATSQEIRKAYIALSIRNHPDKAFQNHVSIEQANEAFKEIAEAYQTLSDPESRLQYDLNQGNWRLAISCFRSDFFTQILNPFSRCGFPGNMFFDPDNIDSRRTPDLENNPL